jgi:hypothetical protein
MAPLSDRIALLRWLAQVKAGTAAGPCQGITTGQARRAIEATTGLVYAAERLTEDTAEQYRTAQREASRRQPKKRAVHIRARAARERLVQA